MSYFASIVPINPYHYWKSPEEFQNFTELIINLTSPTNLYIMFNTYEETFFFHFHARVQSQSI